LTPGKLLNYTGIENAHILRKKAFVFYYVAVVCALLGAEQIGLE